MRVLVVDDDPAARLLVRLAVARLGHACVFASDGDEAWARYKSKTPDVLITDRNMPGLTGAELCRRIRAHQTDSYTYVIMLTVLGEPQDVLDGMRAGADDYVVKPLDPAVLEGRLLAAERVTALHAQLSATRRALVEQARTDPLTGLRNRLHLAQALLELHSSRRRSAAGYSLALCDIDLFKSYNDLYGHPGGDRALRQVADVLREQVRGQDQVFRYGGEEFLVLLPSTTADQATVALERVRAAVRAAAVPHRGSPHGVLTLSIGVAGCPPSREITSVALLDEADAALYTAKQAGRDRVDRVTPAVLAEARPA